jgi:OPA family glycerol-3-phosphate transporter-like MFS transporter
MSAGLLRKWQNKVLILCWCGYAGAYLCRTNLSIALPGMMNSQGWSNTDAGLIGSVFFWAYAMGQLINGFIGDRLKSRYFIFTGLAASALINLCVGFSSSLPLTIALWCANGFFLSMLWGPIVKTVSVWFPKKKWASVAVILSISMIGGYFLAWGLIGRITAELSWRWAFWIPAAVVFAYSLVWLLKMRNHPAEVGLQSPGPAGAEAGTAKNSPRGSFVRMIIDSKLWLVAVACIAQGSVKDGISLWAPTFLKDSQHLSQGMVSLFSLAIPAMSLFGIFGAGWLLKMLKSDEIKSSALLLSCTAVVSFLLFLFIHAGAIIAVLLMSVTVALMYGANTILLTMIPLNFEKYDRTSATAGFLDFSSYLGASAAGVLTGLVIDRFGWKYVVLSWTILAVLGAVCVLPARNRSKNAATSVHEMEIGGV